jgi:hypothetical protein
MPADLLMRWIKNLLSKPETAPQRTRRVRSGAQRRDPRPWRPAIEFLEDRTTPVAAVIAASYFDSAVYALDPNSGALLQTLVPPNSPSAIDGPAGTVVGPDGNLYLSSQNNDAIVEYNVTTQALSTLIPSSVLDPIAAANHDSVFAPSGLAFGPDGNLYVSLNGGRTATSGGAVVRFGITDTGSGLSYNGTTMTIATGLVQPTGMVFGTGGDASSLYVSNSGAGTVVKIAGATGSAPVTTTFVTAGEGGLDYPSGLTWAPDGALIVTDMNVAHGGSGQLLAYTPTGAFDQVFHPDDTAWLSTRFPSDALFLPDGDLLVAEMGPTDPVSLGGPGTSGMIADFSPNEGFRLLDAAGFPVVNMASGVTNFSPSALAYVNLPSISGPGGQSAPTVSAPSPFNPRNPLPINVSSTDPNFFTITVNWGDGTVQTFNGPPGNFTHQYALANTSYTIQVSMTDTNQLTFAASATTVAALPTGPDSQVASLYLDLLGRDADASGLSYWSGLLASGTPMSQVVNGIMASPEYQDRVLNDLYQKYLGRPVDSVGMASWLPVLQSSGSSAVAAGLLGSLEFFAKAGGTNTDFLRALYLDALGRAIDPTALTNDLQMLQAGVSREQIAAGVLGSSEKAQEVVNQAYQAYLGRSADASALPGWEQAATNDPATFWALFLSAPEVAQRAAANTTTVPTSPQSS